MDTLSHAFFFCDKEYQGRAFNSSQKGLTGDLTRDLIGFDSILPAYD